MTKYLLTDCQIIVDNEPSGVVLSPIIVGTCWGENGSVKVTTAYQALDIENLNTDATGRIIGECPRHLGTEIFHVRHKRPTPLYYAVKHAAQHAINKLALRPIGERDYGDPERPHTDHNAEHRLTGQQLGIGRAA